MDVALSGHRYRLVRPTILDGTGMLAQGRVGPGESDCERHRPEQTLLYQLVEAHYPALMHELARHDCMDAGGRATPGAVAEGKSLPHHIKLQYEGWTRHHTVDDTWELFGD